MPYQVEKNPETFPVEQLEARLAEPPCRRSDRFCIDRRELDIAVQVHRSLLPESVRHPLIDIDASYLPAHGIGGDYCQVLFPEEDLCCISICDVTGHGIGAALLATRVSSEVRHLTFEGHRPADIVARLNAFILRYFGGAELGLSFFAARIDLTRRKMTYSGAGHPSQLLTRTTADRMEPLKSQNMLLGVTTDCLDDKPEDRVQLEPGDRLLLFTDGLSDMISSPRGLFRASGGIDIAGDNCVGNGSEIVDDIVGRVSRLKPNTLRDDVTLIVATVK